jgi:hypothetical protein
MGAEEQVAGRSAAAGGMAAEQLSLATGELVAAPGGPRQRSLGPQRKP